MDFRAILIELVASDVRFVLVGGVAAVLQGVPVTTFDVDVVQARDPENARKLAAALTRLEACYREHLPKRIEPQAGDLELPGHHLLSTRHGPIDVLGRLHGGLEYPDLIARAPTVDLDDRLSVHVLDLETLIALKTALGREKDRAQLPEYRRTLEERRRERPEGTASD
jgi:hypothetical protein